MNHVVIVESPAKSKTIEKYLGKDYKVLASFGHIRDLPSKDGSVRPDEDFAMDYQVAKDSQKQVKAIADAVKGADSLILATDPDREGEAISWHVLEALKNKKALKKDTKVERVAFNSITKDAVVDAINNPRELDMDLVNAQQARRALDYLVGFNLSPVLWRKLPGSKSAGRVQSVALRLICEREEEIERFVPQEYWDLTGHFTNKDGDAFTARLTQLEGEKLDKFALGNEKDATNVKTRLESKSYHVLEIEKKQVNRHPAPPFTTSTLQQEASRKLGFTAKRTMQTAQKLYEGMGEGGLITYMRTDGISVAPSAIERAREVIGNDYGSIYLPDKARHYKSKQKNAQEAHEAIRPTDVARTPAKVKNILNDDQLKLYSLIWKRMVASQMAPAVFDQVGADIISDDRTAQFRATGQTLKFDGFIKLYREGMDDSEEEKENRLPKLEKNEDTPLDKLDADQHFTQPPPRYGEASLVKQLEELGIGRPSTYASIISVLQERDYVTLEKKRFVPESRGRLVTSFLKSFFPQYVEYDFTAELEDELDEIAEGKLDWKKALSDFWQPFKGKVDEAMSLEITQVIDELDAQLEPLLFGSDDDVASRRKCPSCDDGRLGLKVGKFGAFIGCSNYPECNLTRQLKDAAGADEDGEKAAIDGPRELGKDPESGMEVTLKKGPYGHYVQLGEGVDGEKPKRSSLPKGMKQGDVTLETALQLLSLPREVGVHPETGKKITANNGRYGPYINHDGVFISLKGDDNVLDIGMNRAVELIATQGKKKGAEPLKELGEHPDDKKPVAIFDGKYGPYVKHNRTNASLPKKADPDQFTLEEALELLAAKAKAPKKKRATKKKAS